jgi:D-glycerate 3-kinase
VVILEGWCVGFYPLSLDEIDKRWDGAWSEERKHLGMGDAVRKQDVLDVNEKLKEYLAMWNFFDVFVQVGGFCLSHSSCFINAPLQASTRPVSGRVPAVRHLQVEIGAGAQYEGAKWRKGHVRFRRQGVGDTLLGVHCISNKASRFVDRYIPGYVFFGDGPTVGFESQSPRWIGKSLQIRIDHSRVVVDTKSF